MQKGILVIKHGALGDMIFAMGAFKAIRDHHKKDKVVLLTSPPFKRLAEASPYFDEVWIDDRLRPWQHPFKILLTKTDRYLTLIFLDTWKLISG